MVAYLVSSHNYRMQHYSGLHPGPTSQVKGQFIPYTEICRRKLISTLVQCSNPESLNDNVPTPSINNYGAGTSQSPRFSHLEASTISPEPWVYHNVHPEKHLRSLHEYELFSETKAQF